MPLFPSAGTLAVTANSKAVTGTGTAFTLLVAGDLIAVVQGAALHVYGVAAVASDTSLTLNRNHVGATASGLAYYGIRQYESERTADLAADVATLIADIGSLGTTLASTIFGYTNKATPVDADTIAITDSAASNVGKKTTFAQLWSWVLSKFGDSASLIGIGTAGGASPISPLTIVSSINPIAGYRNADDTTGQNIKLHRSRGTYATPAAVQNGDILGGGLMAAYDGSAYLNIGNLRWAVDGAVAAGDVPTRIEFFNFTAGAGAQSVKLQVMSNGNTRPGADNAYTCGDSARRWSAIWAANGTIQTSDARDKAIAGPLGFAGAMVDAVDPVLFRWHVGGNFERRSATETRIDDDGNEVPRMEIVPRPGRRLHAGFIAQDLRKAMDAASVDFAAWGLDDKADPQSRQWTRPDQLVAVLWAALRQSRSEIAALKSRLDRLESTSGGPRR